MLERIRAAVILTLAGAVAVRIVAELLEPVIPLLIVFGAFAYIASLLFTRNGGSS